MDDFDNIELFECPLCHGPGLLQEEPLPEVNVSHRNYFEHFLKALNGEEEIMVKPCQVRRVLRVMEAVRESARTGKAIELEA